jgi:Spy/CpxP family protein refolding chaperone
MIRKLFIATLLLSAIALAQPPQGGPRMGGPGMDGMHGPKRDAFHAALLPPGRWWKNAEVAQAISLSDAQVQKIEQIFQDNRMKLVDIHATLQKEEIKLEPMLEADNPDENAVMGAIDHIAAARTSLEKANAQMAFAIRRVLTPEQWKKLHTLRPRHDHFPPPMDGPHGHMHGGTRPGAPSEPPAPQTPPDNK